MYYIFLATNFVLSLVSAQQVGTNTAENHPSLSVSTCTKSAGCSTKSQSIVLDANWRWLHTTSGYTNCYTGQLWNTTICPDAATCIKNCAVDGANYQSTYGISTSDSAVDLTFVTPGTSGANIGSRVYLMQNTSNYQMFNLLNGEFSFDVDVSNLPCGLNGALYFSQMDQDGGMKRFPANKAGAAYGTGYCDAQCPRDLKFVNGVANVEDWTPSTNDINSGTGNFGSCCSEMDIWEANSFSAAYTSHPCNVDSATTCSDSTCTSSCDAAGCDFNSWRMGNQTFYGPAMTINTKTKITVVTQFITDDNSNQGNLIQINRFYAQDGKVIPNSYSSVNGVDSVNSLSDAFCAQQKTAFKDDNIFATMGGLKQMGAAFKTGMVLVMSIWDDHKADGLWLDSDYPLSADPSVPGVSRGSCSRSSGAPSDVEKDSANAKVSFSNIKWGELNSTFTTGGTGGANDNGNSTATVGSTIVSSTSSSKTSPESTVTTVAAIQQSSSVPSVKPSGCAVSSTKCGAKWTQCAGQEWKGATCCQSGSTCTLLNEWYSQCL